jgi:glycosyltransferase involved in cell wall biosynthesis
VTLIPITAVIRTCHNNASVYDPLKLVYSGSFADKDGVENLVKAVVNISKKQKNICLYLTGVGEKDKMGIIKNICRENKNIKMLGYLKDDEFYEFISQADVLCMTRLDSEFANAGFPFKLGEYLATGKPVIASTVSDVTQYLKDRVDAILVKPGDVLEIEKAIMFMINNRKKAKEIGLSGQKVCSMYFNPSINGEKLSSFLRAI